MQVQITVIENGFIVAVSDGKEQRALYCPNVDAINALLKAVFERETTPKIVK